MDGARTSGQMAGRAAFAAVRLCGTRRGAGKAAFQEDSCNCRSEAVVEGGTGLKDWRDDIEAAVVG